MTEWPPASSSSSTLATLQYCSQPAVSAANKQLRKQKSVKVKIINYSINTRRGPNPPTNPNLSCTTFHNFLFNFFFSLSLSFSRSLSLSLSLAWIGGRFLEISDLRYSVLLCIGSDQTSYRIILFCYFIILLRCDDIT